MAAQMTREEFERKFGVSPGGQQAPVQMTRAQFEERFGTSPEQEQPQQLESSFFSNLKDHFNRRVDTAAEAQLKSIQGEQTAFSGTLQTLGQGAAFVGDVGLEAIKAVTPQSVEDVVAMGLSHVGQTKTVQELAENYADWKADHPEAAGNLEAGINIAGLIPIGKVGTGVGQGVSTAARPVTRAGEMVVDVGRGAVNVTGNTARGMTSQLTGLPVRDIDNFINRPQSFSKEALDGIDRESILTNFKQGLDDQLEELGGLGSQYENIRNSGAVVDLDTTNWLANQLDTFNIKVQKVPGQKAEDGIIQLDPTVGQPKLQIVTDTNTKKILSKSDTTKLNDFINKWGDKQQLSANEFLNMRRELSKLSRFDESIGKSHELEDIAKNIRKSLDTDDIKGQIPNLKELDDKFAPEITRLSKLRSDIYNADGTLKDGAANKLAGSINAGRGELLTRLKQIDPNIELRVEQMRAVENIEKASGFQVGSYAKSAGIGAGVGLFLGGSLPVGAVVGMILSYPQAAVPLLRKIGATKQQMSAVNDAIIHSINTTNRKAGEAIEQGFGRLPVSTFFPTTEEQDQQ